MRPTRRYDTAHSAIQRAVVGPADTVLIGQTTFSVITLHRLGGTAPSSPVVEFNRSPRVVPRFPYRPLKAPTPPKEPSPQFFPVFMMFAPLLMGGFMFALTGSPFALIFVFIWVRATLPRLRYDQLMSLGWKIFLPLATLNALVTAIVVVAW